jgi:hypothetical protein
MAKGQDWVLIFHKERFLKITAFKIRIFGG